MLFFINQIADRFTSFVLDLPYRGVETDKDVYERVVREKEECLRQGIPYHLDSEDWYRCQNYLASIDE